MAIGTRGRPPSRPHRVQSESQSSSTEAKDSVLAFGAEPLCAKSAVRPFIPRVEKPPIDLSSGSVGARGFAITLFGFLEAIALGLAAGRAHPTEPVEGLAFLTHAEYGP